MKLALSRYGEELLELYPSDLRADMAEALQELLSDAAVLSREVDDAERRGIAFAQAVRNAGEFPRMARVHFGAIDLLQTEFADDERATLHEIVDRASSSDADAVRRHWFVVAAEDEPSRSGPLMRFLLYQAVRLNVWVLTWAEGAPLEAAGAFRELDERAERQLRERLAMDEMQDPAVRPLRVLVAQAVEHLSVIWDQRKRNLGGERPEAVELFHGLTRAAQVARNLNAGDAALVRNELEGANGGAQLGSRELAERNPALKSQNATDQRRRRLLASLRDQPDPQPPGSRLIDLLDRG